MLVDKNHKNVALKDSPKAVDIIEGSLEVKLPTIWTVGKQRWEESEEKRSEERRSEEKESEERRCRCAKR
jgi:hypothetical protein